MLWVDALTEKKTFYVAKNAPKYVYGSWIRFCSQSGCWWMLLAVAADYAMVHKKSGWIILFHISAASLLFFCEVWVFRKTLGKHEQKSFFSGMEVIPKLCRATVQKRHEILVFVCPFCWFLWLCSKIHDHIKVNETNKMNFFIPGLFPGVCLCWRCIFVVGWSGFLEGLNVWRT